MQDSAKYLIHAQFRANGVVERSDVVGAIFGQTEGLLGEELDLRDLQESSKVGRIDVEMTSSEGESSGTVTIASGLDRAETAVLAAGLETIERIGPCRSEFEVTDLEDARAAKRRDVVARATDLLADFEESTLRTHELVEEVRQNVRVEDVTDYRGFPAGPNVADTDAIIVVEGRADVLQLLKYGIKTAIAVEGTDVPEEIADLTQERTVTAFLDGDRGGNLILQELAQVGNVDYVAFAPEGKSVEDLDREEVLAGLRTKVSLDEIENIGSARAELSRTPHEATSQSATAAQQNGASDEASADDEMTTEQSDTTGSSAEMATSDDDDGEAEPATEDETADASGEPVTLSDHVEAVVGGQTGQVRLLDADFDVLMEGAADTAFDAIERADPGPHTVVVDGDLSQRVLDIAAQRNVPQVVARQTGEFVKRPTSVRIRTADTF